MNSKKGGLSMARKNESGISYFPMNTDHHQNSKIKLLINDCGPVAYMVFQFMCSEGYNKDGYFFDASDEDTLTLFASDICKIPLDTVNKIISCCIKRKLFDGEMYTRFQILTSKRMQSNYLEAVKRRTTGTSILDKFNLIKDGESSSEIHNVNKSEGNVDRSIQNVAETSKNVDSGTQNRIDKIREEKKREEKTKSVDVIPPPELLKDLLQFLNKHVQKYYPKELHRQQEELNKWCQKHNVTASTDFTKDPDLDKKFNDECQRVFNKHIHTAMILDIEDCFNHYAKTDFVIKGEAITNWNAVMIGWMKRKTEFENKKAKAK